MNCGWREIRAILRKEIRLEFRSRAGLIAALLVPMLAVIAMGLASQREKPGPELAAGILTITLLFGSISSLPRVIFIEEEQQTFSLLRLQAPPTAIYWGKWLYAVMNQIVIGLVTSVLFVNMAHVEVKNPLFVVLFAVLSPLAVVSTIMLTGALVLGENNLWILGAVLSLPLLIPQTVMSIGVLRYGFGVGFAEGAWINAASLLGYSFLAGYGGALIANSLWTRGSSRA